MYSESHSFNTKATTCVSAIRETGRVEKKAFDMLAPHWTEKAANSFLIRPLDHEALVEVVVTTLYILRTEQFLNARSVEAWRFLRMLAASHAQVWNASQIGMSLGLDGKTVNSYLDHLVGAYLIRRLSPYQANTRKRLVKRPKVFWRDTGLLHALLNVSDEDTLLGQPWVGHSWEGFVIEQIIGELFSRGAQFEAYWMRTSDHHELDLVLDWGGRSFGRSRSSSPHLRLERTWSVWTRPRTSLRQRGAFSSRRPSRWRETISGRPVIYLGFFRGCPTEPGTAVLPLALGRFRPRALPGWCWTGTLGTRALCLVGTRRGLWLFGGGEGFV